MVLPKSSGICYAANQDSTYIQTFANFHQSTRRHIPEDGTLHTHRRENLEFLLPYRNDLYSFRMVQIIIQAGVPPIKIHLIGMSLGGQLAAYVAKDVPDIGRLTGKV
jgi:pimeloyl-ACP methyl ester carboxylesterase